MKKYLFFLLAFLILQLMALSVSASNSAGSGCGCGDVTATSTAIDKDGNVYVTGAFNSSYLFSGTNQLTNQSTGKDGCHDMFIVKYDNGGNLQWAKSAGGNYSDIGRSIATDASGNVYVTGGFNSSSIDFGGEWILYNTGTNAGSGYGDMFIAKYDEGGNIQWAKKAGGSDNDYGNSIATDAIGNIYVTGTSNSSDLTFGFVTPPLTYGGSYDMFIVKYNTNGDGVWTKSAGGSGDDNGSCIATDGSSVYVTGWFNSSSIDDYDILINKYDINDGTVYWSKTAGGTGNDYATSITTDASGVYVTGYFGSPSISFGGTDPLSIEGDYNMFIVSYDAGGTFRWASSAEGSLWNEGQGIATDGIGNVFVTGGFAGTSITFGGVLLKNNRNRGVDIFIVKYHTVNGNAQWARAAGGSKVDIGKGIATDAFGKVFVTGYFQSTSITFGELPPLNIRSVYTNTFIAQYDADGSALWAKAVIGTCVQGKPKSTNAGLNDEPINGLTIYPNPTRGMVIVSTASSQSAINNVSVVNVIGKEVLIPQFTTGSNEVEIDLSSQPKGLYILLIHAGEDFYSRKIILE